MAKLEELRDKVQPEELKDHGKDQGGVRKMRKPCQLLRLTDPSGDQGKRVESLKQESRDFSWSLWREESGKQGVGIGSSGDNGDEVEEEISGLGGISRDEGDPWWKD